MRIVQGLPMQGVELRRADYFQQKIALPQPLVFQINIRVAPEDLLKQCFTIEAYAVGSLSGGNLICERKGQPLLKIPLQPLLFLRKEWIADRNLIRCAIGVKLHRGSIPLFTFTSFADDDR